MEYRLADSLDSRWQSFSCPITLSSLAISRDFIALPKSTTSAGQESANMDWAFKATPFNDVTVAAAEHHAKAVKLHQQAAKLHYSGDSRQADKHGSMAYSQAIKAAEASGRKLDVTLR
jgi:hypothetical protein